MEEREREREREREEGERQFLKGITCFPLRFS